MIKFVIFDLDGTLLNTLEDLKESTNFALNQFGYPTRTIDEIKNFVGDGVKKLIERAVPENCTNIDECLSIFKENYSKNMYNNTVPYDGIINILKELRENGIKTAVVSNKFDKAVKELCQKYFPNLIDIAIGQSENICPKPCPDGVLKAMEILGANITNTVYVGDSDIDIQTAQNAHLPSIGVCWGFRDKKNLEGANFIAEKPEDIINIIKKMEKLSISLEDYIEEIYNQVLKFKEAKVTAIAKALGVRKASVTGALNLLAEKGLINYSPYMPVTLTEKGREIAQNILKKHENITEFFTSVLNIPEKEARETACKMEHIVSDKVFNNMNKLTQYIKTNFKDIEKIYI